MKSFFLFLALLSLSLASSPRLLQFLRLLSPECNYHGYLYKTQCFCKPEWQGAKCELARAAGYSDDASTVCDDLLARLDFLTNISPENYPGDDYEFSRFSDKTIGQGDAAYGDKANTWIKMHDITTSWQVFGGVFQATDIHQGALGNCYLLAALASLAVHRNGQYIKDVFFTKADNDKHVYVTRWMVAGKPRFVAVDDYVPGSGKSPSFSQVTADFDYWAMIIEKAWAKIHGNYMITEGGIQTNVWKSLTQAPIFTKYIDTTKDTPAAIFSLIKDKFSKLYPIGAATPNGITTEVEGHAYSIIGAYDLTLSTGAKVQLIKMYNPWNKEVWTSNPWADSSSKWTTEIKSLVGYVNANDGVFFVAPADFITIFDLVNWAEVNPGYEVSYVDIPIDTLSLNLNKAYTTNLKVSGNTGKLPVYVYVDQPNSRLFENCGGPYQLYSMKATTSAGASIQPTQVSEYVVTLTNDDTYTFSANLVNKASYSKYVTVTAYHPKGVLTFTSTYTKIAEKGCAALNNCYGNGKCNYLSGTCQCFTGFGGSNCASKVALTCPSNCNNNGVCDTSTGLCACKAGFSGATCSPCVDVKATECPTLRMSYCDATNANFNYMKAYCQRFCGDLGYKTGFEGCYVPRDPIKYPCKYLEDQYSASSCAQYVTYCKDVNNPQIKQGCAKTCCGK